MATSEIEIKRSRFLAFITQADSEEAARAFIAEIKGRFPDARHHCSAFVVNVDGQLPIERSNDDGEPSGTAGQPILEVLKGTGLLDIVAVSVRYFGGVKLGTGGLVRAYSDSISSALPQLKVAQRTKLQRFKFSAPHATVGRIEAELRQREVRILEIEYATTAEVTVGVVPGQEESFHTTLAELSSGHIEAKEAGHCWIDE